MIEKKSDWPKLKPAEMEKLVVSLHKENNSPAKIGLILRDQHGIPKAKLVSKKITKILEENNLSPITEKSIVQKRIGSLEKHISNHKHDYTAKRSLTKKLWAVKRLKN